MDLIVTNLTDVISYKTCQFIFYPLIIIMVIKSIKSKTYMSPM